MGGANLVDERLSVLTDTGANPGLRVSTLVAGMLAGADSIDDLALLRQSAMSKLFEAVYAPATLGFFLRTFTFGHVRQLDAVAFRLLAGFVDRVPLLRRRGAKEEFVFVDVAETIVEVHGYQK